MRKYKYNNRFCKKKHENFTQKGLKTVFFRFFIDKNGLNREFFCTFVRSFNKIRTLLFYAIQ